MTSYNTTTKKDKTKEYTRVSKAMISPCKTLPPDK